MGTVVQTGLRRRLLLDAIVLIVPGDVFYKDVNPSIPLLVALRTQNMSIRGHAWVFLPFDDQEGMPVFVLFVAGLWGARTLLSTDLGPSDRNRTQVGATSL